METTLRMKDTISLNNTNVIYQNNVYRALSITPLIKCQPNSKRDTRYKPTFLEIYAINKNGEFEILNDETWCFEFKKNERKQKKKWLLRKQKKASQ